MPANPMRVFTRNKKGQGRASLALLRIFSNRRNPATALSGTLPFGSYRH